MSLREVIEKSIKKERGEERRHRLELRALERRRFSYKDLPVGHMYPSQCNAAGICMKCRRPVDKIIRDETGRLRYSKMCPKCLEEFRTRMRGK